jgi:hypothetical protein
MTMQVSAQSIHPEMTLVAQTVAGMKRAIVQAALTGAPQPSPGSIF